MGKNLTALLLLPLLAYGQWEMDFDEDWQLATTQRWTPTNLSPVVWYKGENNANDAMGYADGTWGGVAAYGSGINGTAFSFSSANYVSIGNPAMLQTSNNVSLVAWVKPESFANYRAIWGGGYLGVSIGYGLFQSATETCGQYRYEGTTAIASIAHGSSTNWTHLAFTVNGDIKTLYVNAVPVSTVTQTIANVVASCPWGIGARNASGVWGYKYCGLIDDVMFFRKALTPDEITQLYQWRQ